MNRVRETGPVEKHIVNYKYVFRTCFICNIRNNNNISSSTNRVTEFANRTC